MSNPWQNKYMKDVGLDYANNELQEQDNILVQKYLDKGRFNTQGQKKLRNVLINILTFKYGYPKHELAFLFGITEVTL